MGLTDIVAGIFIGCVIGTTIGFVIFIIKRKRFMNRAMDDLNEQIKGKKVNIKGFEEVFKEDE